MFIRTIRTQLETSKSGLLIDPKWTVNHIQIDIFGSRFIKVTYLLHELWSSVQALPDKECLRVGFIHYFRVEDSVSTNPHQSNNNLWFGFGSVSSLFLICSSKFIAKSSRCALQQRVLMLNYIVRRSVISYHFLSYGLDACLYMLCLRLVGEGSFGSVV